MDSIARLWFGFHFFTFPFDKHGRGVAHTTFAVFSSKSTERFYFLLESAPYKASFFVDSLLALWGT